MGKRFRERQKAKANATVTDTLAARPDDLIVNHENSGTIYGPDLTPYDDGTYPVYMLPGGQTFPTPVEHFQTGNRAVAYTHNPIGDISDRIDWEIGGVSGDANGYLWSTGVVDSNTVEDFTLDGRQAIIRRMPNPGGVSGPVATSDHNALLAMSFAQMANQYYPSEQSQLDLIRSI